MMDKKLVKFAVTASLSVSCAATIVVFLVFTIFELKTHRVGWLKIFYVVVGAILPLSTLAIPYGLAVLLPVTLVLAKYDKLSGWSLAASGYFLPFCYAWIINLFIDNRYAQEDFGLTAELLGYSCTLGVFGALSGVLNYLLLRNEKLL